MGFSSHHPHSKLGATVRVPSDHNWESEHYNPPEAVTRSHFEDQMERELDPQDFPWLSISFWATTRRVFNNESLSLNISCKLDCAYWIVSISLKGIKLQTYVTRTAHADGPSARTA